MVKENIQQPENEAKLFEKALKELKDVLWRFNDERGRVFDKLRPEMRDISEIEYMQQREKELKVLDQKLIPFGLRLDYYADGSVGFFISNTDALIRIFETAVKLKDRETEFALSSFLGLLGKQVIYVYDHSNSDPRLEDFFLSFNKISSIIKSPGEETWLHVVLTGLTATYEAMKGEYLKEYKIAREKGLYPFFPLSEAIKKKNDVLLALGPKAYEERGIKMEDQDQYILSNLDAMVDEWFSAIHEISKNEKAQPLITECKKALRYELKSLLSKSEEKYKENIQKQLERVEKI